MKAKSRSLTIYAAGKELFPKKKKSHETSSVHLKINFLIGFYSLHRNEIISDKEYKNVKRCWYILLLKNILDLNNINNVQDTITL